MMGRLGLLLRLGDGLESGFGEVFWIQDSLLKSPYSGT